MLNGVIRKVFKMEFKSFNGLLQKHIEEICNNETHLFVVDLDKDALWNLYLDSFPTGTNEMFRKRREFDCSCCRHFIKFFGNVVAIKDNDMVTVWDFETGDEKYQPVVDALSKFVKQHAISDVLVTDQKTFGTEKTFETNAGGRSDPWYHFYVKLSPWIVLTNHDINEKRGQLRDVRNVFERSLREISIDSIDAVLDLIAQKSLYKGEEWESVLGQFLKLNKGYNKLDDGIKAAYCWKKSVEVGPVIGKIRNHSIGTLLINVSEGMDLDEAVKKYEAIVAPSNYKRPKAVFSKRMVEDAQKTIQELGLEASLERRYANIGDITINNTLYVNRDVKKRIVGNVFAFLAEEISASPKKFEKLEEVSIETFVKDILPKATSVEMFFENKHTGNMVSLIAPKNVDSKTMFKWNNNFSWAYSGNITDSMKERVKAAGGKVDGVLRFSIQWNDKGDDNNDLDAHCIEPGGNEIYYGRKTGHASGGNLDVDIISPKQTNNNAVAVENITWPSRNKMRPGVYKFFVHQFNNRGGRGGFSAEIEFDDKCYSFAYNKELRQGENVMVAEVEMMPNGEFKIKELLSSNVSSRDIWGIKTNQFHHVSIGMYSPNYWDGQEGVGHRHYFFMLKGCKNEESPNGFFNEFLREEFMKHKRVFEALGSKMRVEDSDDQLSGLGFSATKHDSFVVKVEGSFRRTLKVNI